MVIAATAGSIGWALRDRATRDAALDGEVGRILDEAKALLEADKWPEASAAIGRGQKLLAAAGRQDSPAALLELQEDIAMARRLEDVYGHSGEETPSINSMFGNLTTQLVDQVYSKAFREFGIDLDALTVDEAAQRLRGRSIRVELARALDFWASTIRARDQTRTRTGADW